MGGGGGFTILTTSGAPQRCPSPRAHALSPAPTQPSAAPQMSGRPRALCQTPFLPQRHDLPIACACTPPTVWGVLPPGGTGPALATTADIRIPTGLRGAQTPSRHTAVARAAAPSQALVAGGGVPPPPRNWSCPSIGGAGGGGSWSPKSPKGCVPQTAPINTSVCKSSCFPTMKSGSEGAGGVSPPPPHRPPEMLRCSATVCPPPPPPKARDHHRPPKCRRGPLSLGHGDEALRASLGAVQVK